MVILYLHRHLSCGNYMYCIYVYLPFFIHPENGGIPKMRVDKFELHLLMSGADASNFRAAVYDHPNKP